MPPGSSLVGPTSRGSDPTGWTEREVAALYALLMRPVRHSLPWLGRRVEDPARGAVAEGC